VIYSAGNFIECTVDTRLICRSARSNTGKPVLDRAINYEMDIYDALKVGLISIDSTLRSNLSVGLPIDLMVLRPDTCDPELIYRIEPGEPLFHRYARALVGRPARGPYRHTPAALRQPALKAEFLQPLPGPKQPVYRR